LPLDGDELALRDDLAANAQLDRCVDGVVELDD